MEKSVALCRCHEVQYELVNECKCKINKLVIYETFLFVKVAWKAYCRRRFTQNRRLPGIRLSFPYGKQLG